MATAHGAAPGAARSTAALLGAPCPARGPNLRAKSLVTGLYTYADALVICEPRFDDANGHKDWRKFHIEQAVTFKAKLDKITADLKSGAVKSAVDLATECK